MAHKLDHSCYDEKGLRCAYHRGLERKRQQDKWTYLCRNDREFDALIRRADQECAHLGHRHPYKMRHCVVGLTKAEAVMAERWGREWVDGVGWPAKRVPIVLGPGA